MPLYTFYFKDGLPLATFVDVLQAVDQFDLRTRPFLRFSNVALLHLFGLGVPLKTKKLSSWVRQVEKYERTQGEGPRLVRARFESPGFVTVDATGPLDKLIDILHHGNLDKEQQKAIIDRINAETELIRAKAAKKKIDVLTGAISALNSLGYGPQEIVLLLSRDEALTKLLGEPVATLQAAQKSGSVEKALPGGTEE